MEISDLIEYVTEYESYTHLMIVNILKPKPTTDLVRQFCLVSGAPITLMLCDERCTLSWQSKVKRGNMILFLVKSPYNEETTGLLGKMLVCRSSDKVQVDADCLVVKLNRLDRFVRVE